MGSIVAGGYMQFHPDTVQFDSVTCCAFANVHIGAWGGTSIAYIVRHLEIFLRTSNLAYIPTDEDVLVYTLVAEREIDYLERVRPVLDCGHTFTEHILALRACLRALTSKIPTHH